MGTRDDLVLLAWNGYTWVGTFWIISKMNTHERLVTIISTIFNTVKVYQFTLEHCLCANQTLALWNWDQRYLLSPFRQVLSLERQVHWASLCYENKIRQSNYKRIISSILPPPGRFYTCHITICQKWLSTFQLHGRKDGRSTWVNTLGY